MKSPSHTGTVHPHTCGEIAAKPTLADQPNGSPPHVWGNLWRFLMRYCNSRFTPTRVGKSMISRCIKIAVSVHPHTCGEIRAAAWRDEWDGGSPPHVWGNHWHYVNFSIAITVHPHTCGEIALHNLKVWHTLGSPPHVWGNPVTALIGIRHNRFTPTRVGKSRHTQRRTYCNSVHPHTCGEISCSLVKTLALSGSPPHVWGNLMQ